MNCQRPFCCWGSRSTIQHFKCLFLETYQSDKGWCGREEKHWIFLERVTHRNNLLSFILQIPSQLCHAGSIMVPEIPHTLKVCQPCLLVTPEHHLISLAGHHWSCAKCAVHSSTHWLQHVLQGIYAKAGKVLHQLA